MLRIKEVEVAGQTFKIGNLQLGPKRKYIETLAAVQAGNEAGISMVDATVELLLSSLQRADPSITRGLFDTLDDDDLTKLLTEVTRWSGPRNGDPGAGETPSP
jgi:hypothetical protein